MTLNQNILPVWGVTYEFLKKIYAENLNKNNDNSLGIYFNLGDVSGELRTKQQGMLNLKLSFLSVRGERLSVRFLFRATMNEYGWVKSWPGTFFSSSSLNGGHLKGFHTPKCTFFEEWLSEIHTSLSLSAYIQREFSTKRKSRIKRKAEKGYRCHYSLSTGRAAAMTRHCIHGCTTLFFGSWTVRQTSENRNLEIKRLKFLPCLISDCAVWGYSVMCLMRYPQLQSNYRCAEVLVNRKLMELPRRCPGEIQSDVPTMVVFSNGSFMGHFVHRGIVTGNNMFEILHRRRYHHDCLYSKYYIRRNMLNFFKTSNKNMENPWSTWVHMQV